MLGSSQNTRRNLQGPPLKTRSSPKSPSTAEPPTGESSDASPQPCSHSASGTATMASTRNMSSGGLGTPRGLPRLSSLSLERSAGFRSQEVYSQTNRACPKTQQMAMTTALTPCSKIPQLTTPLAMRRNFNKKKPGSCRGFCYIAISQPIVGTRELVNMIPP